VPPTSPQEDTETRPDLYVVARFLEKLIAKGGSRRKTELQMAVGLNFNVYTKYLGWMESKNLIHTEEKDERSKHVSITPKGLETYKTLVGWIKKVVGSP
jgi:predicted transcriptional regulator